MDKKLYIISGFSGCGKGTILKEVLSRNPNLQIAISTTTRSPRFPNEAGYFFVTKSEFENQILAGDFLEYTQYNENYYGTSIKSIQDIWDQSKTAIVEINPTGFLSLKKMFSDPALGVEVVSVFITTPTAEQLYAQLVGRNSENAESLRRRLAEAVKECDLAESYDHILVNHNVDRAAGIIDRFISSGAFSEFDCNFDFQSFRLDLMRKSAE